MPRVRTIKPEFPEDETLGRVSRDARLLFILLWTRADDYGRFRAAPAYLRNYLYPYDADVTDAMITGWLQELERVGRVQSYEVRDERYAVVANWAKHQRTDNAGRSLWPAPPWDSESCGESPRDSADVGISPTSDSDVESNDTSTFRNLAASRRSSPVPLPFPFPSSPAANEPVDNSSGVPAKGEEERTDQSLKDGRVHEAVRVLAQRDLERRLKTDERPVADRTAWLRAAEARRAETDAARIAALHDRHPGWTGRRLAQELDRPAEYVAEGTGGGAPPPPDIRTWTTTRKNPTEKAK